MSVFSPFCPFPYFLDKPKISEEYEATAMARISSTIDSVFRDEALPYGHESIYRVSAHPFKIAHNITNINATINLLNFAVELRNSLQVPFGRVSVPVPLREM